MQDAPAFALAWAAGGVDAIGFLTLFHLFTAHMSGNSAAMGAYLGHGELGMGLWRAFPIPIFVLGVAIGAAISEAGLRRKTRHALLPTLGLECALLLGFLFWGRLLLQHGALRAPVGWRYYALAALPALAMGVQNAVLPRVGTTTVRTTYVSGMLTDFAEKSVEMFFWLRDRTRGRFRSRFVLAVRAALHHRTAGKVVLYGGIWVAYVIGAILGSAAQGGWGLWALLLPLSCLFCLMGTVFWRDG
jgi:uncharacterized membrane protein YoaK (UPF0700 family)